MAKEKSTPISPAGDRRFIVLAAGQSSPQMIPVAKVGVVGLTGLFLRAGEPQPVVASDSPEEGVSEALAESLVDRGLCIYSGEPVTAPDGTDGTDGTGNTDIPPAE